MPGNCIFPWIFSLFLFSFPPTPNTTLVVVVVVVFSLLPIVFFHDLSNRYSSHSFLDFCCLRENYRSFNELSHSLQLPKFTHSTRGAGFTNDCRYAFNGISLSLFSIATTLHPMSRLISKETKERQWMKLLLRHWLRSFVLEIESNFETLQTQRQPHLILCYSEPIYVPRAACTHFITSSLCKHQHSFRPTLIWRLR